ncbi:MAG: hypothetical protein J6M65_11475 [Eubacterium sp.]|nr:hypothetical protein [Eubacterium sp.]
MRIRRTKLIVAFIIFALSFSYLNVPSYAAETIEEDTVTCYVGDCIRIFSSELIINGKKYKKLKKKVKVINYGSSSGIMSYRKKDYFKSISAYKNENEYDAENGESAYKYLPKEYNYELLFKKAGTYTITEAEYEADRYSTDYNSATKKNIIVKYNFKTEEYEELTSFIEVPARSNKNPQDKVYKAADGKIYNRADDTYYVGANGVIYGRWPIVPVKVLKGADGEFYLRYSANFPKKVYHRKKVIVKKYDGVVKSIKLGKASKVFSKKYKYDGYTSKSTEGKFLTGNSGKLTVTMADKKYKFGGAVVATNDAEGRDIYTPAKNKSTVAYDNNYAKNIHENADKSVGHYKNGLFKTTNVYVAYKDTALGKGTEVSGTADNPVIVNYKRKKIRGNYYNQSDTYRLNRIKKTNKDGSYDLRFIGTKTTSVPYYDKTSKTIKYDTKVTKYTEKNSISNLINYMDNYKSYSFHKK